MDDFCAAHSWHALARCSHKSLHQIAALLPRDTDRQISASDPANLRSRSHFSFGPCSAVAYRKGLDLQVPRARAGNGRWNHPRTRVWAPRTDCGRAFSGPGRSLRILVDVSETRDKRRRSDLDLFVLALIESAVSTPYGLRTAAGLSPGATIPALRRLLEAGLVVAKKPGSRGRTDHTLTPEGRRYLKSSWRGLIDDGPSGHLDADLRVALLALWVGRDRRLAADFLRKSAAQKLESIISVEEPAEPISLPPLGLWYRDLRSASAKALIRGEASAVLAMAKALPRSLSGKRPPTRSGTKP